MKLLRCKRCALPETFPGITITDSVCNYCHYYDIYKDREKLIKNKIEKKVLKIIYDSKKKNNEYDCVVAFSGGKDSTYLLHFLKKKFKLKILAHTLDNGFISKTTIENIKNTTSTLGIDHKYTKPDYKMMSNLFKSALTKELPYPKEILTMMSPVCSTCIGMVFGTTIKLALDYKIPILVIGLTPGQYPAISLENFFKVESFMFFSEKVYKDDPMDILKILRDPINEKIGETTNDFFFKSQYLDKNVKMPKVVFPFHSLCEYDEKKILKEIQSLGWKRPTDTDNCSTNCRLNSLAIYAGNKQLKYHPYIGEMSMLVRQGKMTYEEAIEAEKLDENSETITQVLKQLKLKRSDLI